MHSEKAIKFCEISTVDLSYVVPVKSTVEILKNYLAFSEYMNFNNNIFLIIVSDVCGLRNSVQVELLQDQTHLMLQEYCNSKGQLSTGKLRFGKILLTMPIISQVCYS